MSDSDTDKAYVVDTYYARTPGPDDNPGWTFQGWSESPSGPATIAGGAVYQPPSDIKLYAQWAKKEVEVHVTVYSWNSDYSVTFTEPNGDTHVTTAQENTIVFTQVGSAGQLKVSAPGLFLQVPAGQTFHGTDGYGYVNLDGSTAVRTFAFTVGEFTQLYVSKMPVEQMLTLDGAYHSKTTQYGIGGTLFGGHKYAVHWYDDYKFIKSGSSTSTKTSYTFDRSDQSFINTAHKGLVTSHTMHIWVGYKDMQTGTIYETVNFNKTGMQRSEPGKLANFYTCEFDELVLDFSDQPRSNRYLLGYSVTDDGSSCAGIKFRGKYRVYLADDDCGGDCTDWEY